MKNSKTILLAEDNPRDAELTLEAISACNLANPVAVVKDGVEALEYLQYQGKYKSRKKENPAVILMDIKMPRMDGIEVLQAIRTLQDLKLLPVVMLTSSREKTDLQRSYEFGANAYVVKPVNFSEFMDTIKNVSKFWATINELPQPEN
jgi:two-component system response regulator